MFACVGSLHPSFLLHRETVMIFAETDLENLASLVPCFETEGSGL